MAPDPDRPDCVCNWTYFFDFIEVFRTKNSRKDWKHVLVEIGYAMRSSPSYPELEPIGESVFRFLIEFDDGRIVVIDFEQNANGIIEPVMGGSNQE